jgi:hypothetical protein
MDYPFLQPKYLEKEFTGGQLHLYTSVFGAGLILRGVELPAVREPAYVTPPAVETLVELPEDVEDAVELLEDVEDAVELPEDEEALVDLPEDEEALVDLPEDEEAMVDLPEDEEALVDLPEDKEALVDLPEDEEALVDLPEDEEPLVDLPVDEASLEETQVDDKTEKVATPAKWRRPGGWLRAGLAMVAMLCLVGQGRLVMGFVAYDCANSTNRMDAYSLLEPAACPTHGDHHEVERTIFGEIVQMKKDRTVPIFKCMVIESVMSQYCGFN